MWARILFASLLVAGTAWAETLMLEDGMVHTAVNDGVVRSVGIPYAAPPVDELRWKAPQRVEPWGKPYPGKNFGPACPQSTRLEEVYGTPLGETSEDCLYLNVWAPVREEGAPLAPVMVWLHGGGNTAGKGSTEAYDGTELAKQGVVVVTLNYRLGIFGFFAHPDLSSESPEGVSGNYGLLDQIAALQWVQRNISKFGGDQSNVTVFGESAGALDLCILMASPLSKGLIHKGIAQSGHAFGPARHLKEKRGNQDSAEALGSTIAGAIGVKELAGLRALDADTLFEKTMKYVDATSGVRADRVGPCVDGWLLPDTPAKIFEAGKQLDIPLIVGANADEGTIFSRVMPIRGIAGFKAAAAILFRRYVREALDLYPVDGDEDVPAALAEATGDMMFLTGARRYARLMENVPSNAWFYYFTHVGDTPMHKEYGAFHGSEIAYAFHNVEGQSALEDIVSAYWVQFAKTGNPNRDGLPEWPAYTTKNDIYLELGDVVTPKAGLKTEKLDLFDKVYALDQ